MMSNVHESLVSFSDIDTTSSVNNKSFDCFFNKHFISLDLKHDSRYKLEQRLITMSVSLHAQTLWSILLFKS